VIGDEAEREERERAAVGRSRLSSGERACCKKM